MPFPQEIEHLIFRGFLTAKLEVGEVHIVLKSINENENDLIKQLSTSPRDKILYILSFSVFLFEKENVLTAPRLEKIKMLFDFFKRLKSNVLKEFLNALKALNLKTSKTIKDVQRFVYDDLSRMRWHSVKSIPLNSSQYTGIDGTENLGLNLQQQLWYAFNHADDLHQYSDIAWDMVKIVLRTQMKKQDFNRLEANDKKHKREREERRQRILSGKEIDTESRSTREGLVTELKKAIAGEKDAHDEFIADYEKQMKERSLVKELALKHLRELRDQGVDIAEVTSSQRSATEEEVEKLTSPRRKELPTASTQPAGQEKFGQQMADLSPDRREEIIKEVEQKQRELGLDPEELEKMQQNADEFFVGSETREVSEEELNNKLLKVKPGTPEYRELAAQLRKKNAWKL